MDTTPSSQSVRGRLGDGAVLHRSVWGVLHMFRVDPHHIRGFNIFAERYIDEAMLDTTTHPHFVRTSYRKHNAYIAHLS